MAYKETIGDIEVYMGPSIPGPEAPDDYKGICTSDMRTMIKYKDIWYRPYGIGPITIANDLKDFKTEAEKDEWIQLLVESHKLDQV